MKLDSTKAIIIYNVFLLVVLLSIVFCSKETMELKSSMLYGLVTLSVVIAVVQVVVSVFQKARSKRGKYANLYLYLVTPAAVINMIVLFLVGDFRVACFFADNMASYVYIGAHISIVFIYFMVFSKTVKRYLAK